MKNELPTVNSEVWNGRLDEQGERAILLLFVEEFLTAADAVQSFGHRSRGA